MAEENISLTGFPEPLPVNFLAKRNLDSGLSANESIIRTSSMGTREVCMRAAEVTLRKSWIISAA